MLVAFASTWAKSPLGQRVHLGKASTWAKRTQLKTVKAEPANARAKNGDGFKANTPRA
jgi:hypothetical protein